MRAAAAETTECGVGDRPSDRWWSPPSVRAAGINTGRVRRRSSLPRVAHGTTRRWNRDCCLQNNMFVRPTDWQWTRVVYMVLYHPGAAFPSRRRRCAAAATGFRTSTLIALISPVDRLSVRPSVHRRPAASAGARTKYGENGRTRSTAAAANIGPKCFFKRKKLRNPIQPVLSVELSRIRMSSLMSRQKVQNNHFVPYKFKSKMISKM